MEDRNEYEFKESMSNCCGWQITEAGLCSNCWEHCE